MRRLVVLGGDGFIGRALHRVCLSEGVEVTSADYGRPDTADATRYVDVTDRQSVRSLLAETQPNAVITLASHGVGTRGLLAGADAHPARAVEVNVGGVTILLEECAAASCSHVILASSTTVYGPAHCYDRKPVPERVPLLPATVYGGTKAAAEQVAYPLAARLGMQVAAVRLPLVYGAGRWYGGSQEALVAFADAIAAGRPASVGAWTRSADWMHVEDAARSLFAAAMAPTAAGPYNVVGHVGSLAELAHALAAHATAPALVDEEAEGGPDLPLVSGERARRELPLAVKHESAVSGAHAYVHGLRRPGDLSQ